jgi:hypothetical protein
VGLRQATGLAAGLLCVLIAGTSGHAQSPDTHQVSAECRGSATYFAEFYAGLQTMHSHGLTHFVPGSADAQAYFIQVQKNGEKVEMNVLKGIRGDGTLKPQAKDTSIRLTQAVAKALRSLAEQDAKDDIMRDKASVSSLLIQACSN